MMGLKVRQTEKCNYIHSGMQRCLKIDGGNLLRNKLHILQKKENRSMKNESYRSINRSIKEI